jgi:hypothetical protein
LNGLQIFHQFFVVGFLVIENFLFFVNSTYHFLVLLGFDKLLKSICLFYRFSSLVKPVHIRIDLDIHFIQVDLWVVIHQFS